MEVVLVDPDHSRVEAVRSDRVVARIDQEEEDHIDPVVDRIGSSHPGSDQEGFEIVIDGVDVADCDCAYRIWIGCAGDSFRGEKGSLGATEAIFRDRDPTNDSRCVPTFYDTQDFGNVELLRDQRRSTHTAEKVRTSETTDDGQKLKMLVPRILDLLVTADFLPLGPRALITLQNSMSEAVYHEKLSIGEELWHIHLARAQGGDLEENDSSGNYGRNENRSIGDELWRIHCKRSQQRALEEDGNENQHEIEARGAKKAKVTTLRRTISLRNRTVLA